MAGYIDMSTRQLYQGEACPCALYRLSVRQLPRQSHESAGA